MFWLGKHKDLNFILRTCVELAVVTHTCIPSTGGWWGDRDRSSRFRDPVSKSKGQGW